MDRCSQCQCVNPDHAVVCVQCGCALPTLEEHSRTYLYADEDPSSAITIMDQLHNTNVNTRELTSKPSPETVSDHILGGTLVAPSESPGLPMNESVAQVVHATIPATDPADKQPTPAPAPTIRPKLVVLRGLRIDTEYPLYEGRNTIGRFADKPVDIDLVSQESPEQIWCSRQHAVVQFEKENVVIEDLNSLNGTWVNGVRIYAGQSRQLRAGDVVQIGTVQMKLVIG